MIRITVAQTSVRTIPYTDKKGRDARLYAQNAYAHTVDREGNAAPYPEKIEILLDTDERGVPRPYVVGEYVLHPSAIYVDRNGKLAVAPRLAPVAPKVAAPVPSKPVA
jgi:hypothetical protein